MKTTMDRSKALGAASPGLGFGGQRGRCCLSSELHMPTCGARTGWPPWFTRLVKLNAIRRKANIHFSVVSACVARRFILF